MAKQRMSLAGAVLPTIVTVPAAVDAAPGTGNNTIAPAGVEPVVGEIKKRTRRGNADHTQQTMYLTTPVYRQLRRIAFDEEKKMHDILLEGLSRAFEARGLLSIEELNADSHKKLT